MITEDIQVIEGLVEIPLVSIVMATYNRALTIGRAVNSVLGQSYKNIELIIIDDGSTDNTIEILNNYTDPKIRLYRHETNKGVTAAKNSGLNQIKGEWFTILDSDDEATPDAIESLMAVPLYKDKSVTAVSCNCWDTTNKRFSGSILNKDQYVELSLLMSASKEEYWGITKTTLLSNERFNEKLRGMESTLWFKINEKAKRYYIHKALRIYHTEGSDRIMKSKYDFDKEVQIYENLIDELHFLSIKKKYKPLAYNYICKTGLTVMRASGRKDIATRYYQLLDASQKNAIINLTYKYKIVALIMKYFIKVKFFIRPYLNRLLHRQ
jgi:glycosyltransferase involved in cell wall biosynthesis